MKKSGIKTSSFSRAIEMAKLAAQVGIKEIASGDAKSRLEQALLIANSLSKLKGAAMKFGQILSLDLDNYFPPEAIEILSQLQSAAVAHPFSEIEKIINREISEPHRSKLTSIHPLPIGVASIGQVHKALYDQREIVLKVQYEEVSQSTEPDLKILKTLATSFCQLTGRKMNLEPLFNEFKSILQQELDYELEANFQKKYQERAQILSSKSGFNYRVPTIIDELSSQKVLGMSFESGLILRKWAQKKPNRESRNAIATAVLNLYVHEFFSWGIVQTDPNWGNFLIEEKDGLLSMCVLDFGATRTYSREFIQNYICLLDAVASGNRKKIRDLAISSQLIDSREKESAFQSFERLLINSITPFFQNGRVVTLFNFADRRHIEASQAIIRELSQELVFSPPPYSLVFLHRKLAGVYSILKFLEIEMNVAPYWESMKELAYTKS